MILFPNHENAMLALFGQDALPCSRRVTPSQRITRIGHVPVAHEEIE